MKKFAKGLNPNDLGIRSSGNGMVVGGVHKQLTRCTNPIRKVGFNGERERDSTRDNGV